MSAKLTAVQCRFVDEAARPHGLSRTRIHSQAMASVLSLVPRGLLRWRDRDTLEATIAGRVAALQGAK